MALSQSERLRAVIKWYSGQTRLTHKKISEALGYSNETFFSQMLNGHKEIPKALPGKVAALDPRINPAFLAGESDEMLVPGNGQPEPGTLLQRQRTGGKDSQGGIYIPAELAQVFRDLSDTVRSQQETISLLVKATVETISSTNKKDAM